MDSVVPAVALHHTAAIKSISDSMGKKVKDAPEPETPAQDAAAAVKKSKKAKLSADPLPPQASWCFSSFVVVPVLCTYNEGITICICFQRLPRRSAKLSSARQESRPLLQRSLERSHLRRKRSGARFASCWLLVEAGWGSWQMPLPQPLPQTTWWLR